MTDTQEVFAKLQKANRIMEDLIEMAVSDENISKDEQDILLSINKNLEHYARLIIESISDNVITDDERQKLADLEQKIVDDANNIALRDENLSVDEKRLLTGLIEAIEDI